jgi:hypothetical protein
MGCDPSGVVFLVGGVRTRGLKTPGYEMGMLRIPKECASSGCEEHETHRWRMNISVPLGEV